ncbi:MAG: hypothetical protein ABL984_12035 [Pyrinomonadaceae bacterium]
MGYLFDQKKCQSDLKNFFAKEKVSINSLGSKVNQTFEANVFAATIRWYESKGWRTTIVSPFVNGNSQFKLKFNTRGRPSNYSYAVCEKNGERCQIRHQLRVSTSSFNPTNSKPANICCDVAVTRDVDVDFYGTGDALPNGDLISFAEAKHMSAFAELVASFVGLVHELKPAHLKKVRNRRWKLGDHIPPFLSLSGTMQGTATGLAETIEHRKIDIDIYSFDNPV